MDMSKHKRAILITGAIVALVALAGLSVVAFAQGEAEATPGEPATGPSFEILNGQRTGPAALELAFQEMPADQPARQFIRERMRENLAQALGVSPDALDEARWTAFLATLDDAVAEGHLAQQAADRLVAQAIIRQSATHEELIAAGLGITVDELQAARQEGKTVRQLVDDLGLDATTIGQNLAAFLEDLILQAAGDGQISDQQAQRILDDEFLDRLARGLWRPWLRPHRPAPLRGRG
jgi:hypothetical protein